MRVNMKAASARQQDAQTAEAQAEHHSKFNNPDNVSEQRRRRPEKYHCLVTAQPAAQSRARTSAAETERTVSMSKECGADGDE